MSSVDIDFTGQVAIVTGAAGGIGREHALLLADRGARVVVNDTGGSVSGDGHDPDAARAVADAIIASGGEAVADDTSIATPEGGQRLIDRALAEFGRVDVLVNNAGILRDRTVHKSSPDDVDAVIGVHLLGAFNVTRPAFAAMRERGYGRIVSTSSASGLFGNFGQSAYGAAKAGLVGLTLALAAEGAKYDIRANAIAPLGRTRMTAELMSPEDGERFDPALIAPVVGYLASAACTVTGEIYSVGAGRVARVFVGETRGVVDEHLSPEAVRDRLTEIRDTTTYHVPASVADEMRLYHDHLADPA